MNRIAVYDEIERMFGLVPTMFRELPDSTLELEWKLFKKVQFDEGAVPNKYRELIGLGIAAATKCRYCTCYHTELARLFGATEAEIEDALHYSKSCTGWSSYVNGLQIDFDTFKDEITHACEHAKALEAAKR